MRTAAILYLLLGRGGRRKIPTVEDEVAVEIAHGIRRIFVLRKVYLFPVSSTQRSPGVNGC